MTNIKTNLILIGIHKENFVLDVLDPEDEFRNKKHLRMMATNHLRSDSRVLPKNNLRSCPRDVASGRDVPVPVGRRKGLMRTRKVSHTVARANASSLCLSMF